MKLNNRLQNISEYHFKNLDLIRKQCNENGINVTDLSIGDPDLPVNKKIIDGLLYGLTLNNYNKYPPYEGINELKKEIIKYYNEVYSVKLNLDEVLILIGSKEGINNLIPAVCDFGSYAIIPKPSYPVYDICCKLWGVHNYNIGLKKENSYLPNIGDLSKEILKDSNLLILNYPNNPTGATANSDFYEEIKDICNKNDIVICNDAAYNEILCNYNRPLSLLQNNKNNYCIEIGSFSKSYNMTGFRIGYAVGNSKIIKALSKVKTNVDSGQFKPIQYAALEAIKLDRSYINSIRKVYIERRFETEKVLKKLNINFFSAEGTFYIWCETPEGYSTKQFCEKLLSEYGIIVTPGKVFGDEGSKFFRIALTQEKEKIVSALSAVKLIANN